MIDIIITMTPSPLLLPIPLNKISNIQLATHSTSQPSPHHCPCYSKQTTPVTDTCMYWHGSIIPSFVLALTHLGKSNLSSIALLTPNLAWSSTAHILLSLWFLLSTINLEISHKPQDISQCAVLCFIQLLNCLSMRVLLSPQLDWKLLECRHCLFYLFVTTLLPHQNIYRTTTQLRVSNKTPFVELKFNLEIPWTILCSQKQIYK